MTTRTRTIGDCLDTLSALVASLGKGGDDGLTVQYRGYGAESVVLSGLALDAESPVGVEEHLHAFDDTAEGFASAAEAIRAWALPSAEQARTYREAVAARQVRA